MSNPPTTEELIEITKQDATIRALRMKLQWESTECDESARCFWERCALVGMESMPPDSAASDADLMLTAWRDRFAKKDVADALEQFLPKEIR